jgi:drug/metabolite transporter (DMT)-like permease
MHWPAGSSLGILLGLSGAIFWGLADFAARFASRRVGAYRTLFFMQFFGFLALSPILKFTGGFSGVAPGWRPWALAVLAGVINMAASLSLYHSFEIGVMTIVAPVSSCYPALTFALALASGERINPLRGAGLGVTFVGVLLAATSFSSSPSEANSASPTDDSLENGAMAHVGDAAAIAADPPGSQFAAGVGWAILAALGFGFLFWFLGFYVVPAVGAGVSVWVMRLTAIFSLLLIAPVARQPLRLPRGGVWWLFIAVGALDTSAFVANNAGLRVGQVSVVSVLASLYGAVTVLLSWIFLRERLGRSQWLGIFLIFAGIVLVSM